MQKFTKKFSYIKFWNSTYACSQDIKKYLQKGKQSFFTSISGLQKGGAYFLLNKDTLMDEGIIKFKKYEYNLISHAKDIIEKNNITYFFDIGANLGFYSILLGKLPEIEKIISFEPLPILFQQVTSNILINNLTPKWEGHNCALSDKKDRMEFYYHPYFLGTSSLKKEWAGERATDSIYVDVCIFDDIVNINNQRCYIKIDVEGNEVEVIKGMKNFLSKNHAYIQIESTDENMDTIFNMLSDIGYKLIARHNLDFYISNIANLKN